MKLSMFLVTIVSVFQTALGATVDSGDMSLMTMKKRGALEPRLSGVQCNWTGFAAPRGDTIDALGRLADQARRRGSVPVAPAGPGGCIRMACIRTAALWLCNDNPHQLKLESTDFFINSITAIMNQCATSSRGGEKFSRGQNFEQGNWNTILTSEVC